MSFKLTNRPGPAQAIKAFLSRTTIASAILLSTIAPKHAASQVRDSTRTDTLVYRVPRVEVRAIRVVTTVGGSSAIEVRPDQLELRPAATLEQAFRRLPMLHVRTNSRGESEISARGSESRQVAVLVDGVPLTLAWDARLDASVVPVNAVQELSYIRGLSSMLYGPNVLGGVIELGVAHSFAQPESRHFDIGSGFDNLGGYGGTATLTQPFGSNGAQWLLRAGAGFRDTPGQPLADGITEPIRTDDDLRLNTDATHYDGFTALRYRGVGGGWFSFSGTSFKAERGMAAELGVPDASARLWRYPHVSRTIAVLSGGTGDRNTPLGRGDLEASVGFDVGRTDIDAYTTRQYTTIGAFEDGKDRTMTLRLLGDHTLGKRADLRAAFTLAEIKHDEFLPGAEAVYKQRLMSIGGETVLRLMEGGTRIASLRLTVGGAYDTGETPETGGRQAQEKLSEVGGRLGLSMVVAGGNAMLHAGVSRRGRFPALRELYSGALNRYRPNPDLKPERLSALESGVTTRLGNGEVQAVGFRHQLNDAVVRITLPDRFFFRVNRNQLLSTGVELLASQMFGPVGISGDLTLQSVDLTDTTADVTNKPENLPEIFGSLRVSFPLVLGFAANAGLRHTGATHCLNPATGTDAKLDGGTRLDGDIVRVFTLGRAGHAFSSLETRISVDNVGDTAIYDQCGLPQPGRLLRLQVRLF